MSCQRISQTVFSIPQSIKNGLNALAHYPITRLFLTCIAFGLNPSLSGISLIGGLLGGDRVITFLENNLLQDFDRHFVRIAGVIISLFIVIFYAGTYAGGNDHFIGITNFALAATGVFYSLWVGAKYKVYLNNLNTNQPQIT